MNNGREFLICYSESYKKETFLWNHDEQEN